MIKQKPVNQTKLKYIRISMGHTQESFANEAGVSRLTIIALEGGKQWPSALSIKKIMRLVKAEYSNMKTNDVFILPYVSDISNTNVS